MNDSSYHLKWIQWNSGKIPIVMQSKNGPCPLIATMNVLLLREKIKLPQVLEQITADQLITYLGECIMDSLPDEIKDDENAILNYEQNIHDALEILPKFKTGLDVNVKFTGITDFEFTPELILFDLLRIPLYHGWLCDPNLVELKNAIGSKSYNQLVDYIITNKTATNVYNNFDNFIIEPSGSQQSSDPDIGTKILLLEEFLDETASQLTEFGLNELRTRIKENEIDHGYLTEDRIIWETLDNVEGVGRFFDSSFKLSDSVSSKQVSELNEIDKRLQQVMNDFMVAVSLNDEEEARAKNTGTGSNQSNQISEYREPKNPTPEVAIETQPSTSATSNPETDPKNDKKSSI